MNSDQNKDEGNSPKKIKTTRTELFIENKDALKNFKDELVAELPKDISIQLKEENNSLAEDCKEEAKVSNDLKVPQESPIKEKVKYTGVIIFRYLDLDTIQLHLEQLQAPLLMNHFSQKQI